MNLKDKVVLITGSSSGIGKATALTFAKEGAKIVINYKSNKKGADETVSEIKKLGSNAVSIQSDVADPAQVKKLFEATIKAFGTINILVNNAGSPIFKKPFLEITKNDLVEEFENNFFSMVYCAQESAKIMLQKKSGKIINVSSICGLTGCRRVLPYSSARSALIGFTRALAKILAPNITVNAVAPGFTLTRFWDDMSDKDVKSLLSTTLSKKWVKPEEIADTFIYLAKNDSVTGQVLVVDGGYTVNV